MNNNNKGEGAGALKRWGGGGINFLSLKRVGPLERDLLEKGGGGGLIEDLRYMYCCWQSVDTQ